MNKYLGLLVGDGLSSTAIDYPAISVQWWNPNYKPDYNYSVSVGVLHLVTKFYAFKARCPQTDVVFAGDSQGVDVVVQTFNMLSKADQARVFTVGLGDPHFNPKQTWIDEGPFNPKLQAILVHFWGDQPHSFPRSDPAMSTAGAPMETRSATTTRRTCQPAYPCSRSTTACISSMPITGTRSTPLTGPTARGSRPPDTCLSGTAGKPLWRRLPGRTRFHDRGPGPCHAYRPRLRPMISF